MSVMKSQPLGFLNGLDLDVGSLLPRLKRVSKLTIAVWRNKFRWKGIVKRASNRLRTITFDSGLKSGRTTR